MFQTVHYHLNSNKIKEPVTLVMLADLHNRAYGEKNEVLLGKIKELKPDFVCIAGDMLVGHSQMPYEVAQETTIELVKEFPVFYGLGNHESRMKQELEIYGTRFEDYMAPLKEAGVHILIDAYDDISFKGNQFRIYGYDLPMKYFEKFNRYVFDEVQLNESLGICADKGCFNILLAHNPIYFQQYAAWGADLTLSGHLHGGIIRLPFLGGVITPQAKLFPRYCAGKYNIDEKYLIVSRGLGTHTIPIRFNNPPELSVIHLAPA